MMYASLHPEKIQNLVTLVSPVNSIPIKVFSTHGKEYGC